MSSRQSWNWRGGRPRSFLDLKRPGTLDKGEEIAFSWAPSFTWERRRLDHTPRARWRLASSTWEEVTKHQGKKVDSAKEHVLQGLAAKSTAPSSNVLQRPAGTVDRRDQLVVQRLAKHCVQQDADGGGGQDLEPAVLSVSWGPRARRRGSWGSTATCRGCIDVGAVGVGDGASVGGWAR